MLSLLVIFKRFWPVGVVVMCAAVCFVLNLRLNHVRTQRDEMRAQLITVNTQLEQQNVAILDWKKQSVLQEKRLRDAMQNTLKQREAYQKDVANIMSQQIPADCSAAIEWGILMAQKITREEKNK